VLLLACQSFVAPTPACGQAAAEDAKAVALKERDRLWGETRKLRAAGRTAEAIAAAEAMLAIERRHLGGDHPIVAESLGWLAELQVEREDFAAARAARREALNILRKRLGESDWRVGDARRALEDVEQLAGMDRDRRARLAEVDRLNQTVVDLYRAGKYAEAIPAARQALAIRKAVLGTPPPNPSTSRPWRSARRCWARATPTPPPA
jgi:tetratricopeptide (TPR) repeat protein